MKIIYLDTNIFVYLSDPKSPECQDCLKLLEYCEANKVLTATSTETIQEIIHLFKNVKQLDTGLKLAVQTVKLVDILFPISKSTIEIYLEQVGIYTSRGSRDLLHLGVCLENKVDRIVTFDNDFKVFKELKSLAPQEFVKNGK